MNGLRSHIQTLFLVFDLVLYFQQFYSFSRSACIFIYISRRILVIFITFSVKRWRHEEMCPLLFSKQDLIIVLCLQ